MNSPAPTWTEPTLIVDNEGKPAGSVDPTVRNDELSQHNEPLSTGRHDGNRRKVLRRSLCWVLGIGVIAIAAHWLWPRMHRLALSWDWVQSQPAIVRKADIPIGASQQPAPDPSPHVAGVIPQASRESIAPSADVTPSTPSLSHGISMELIQGFAQIKVIEARMADALSRLERLSSDVQTLVVSEARRDEQIGQLKTALRTRTATKVPQTASSTALRAAKPLASAAATGIPAPPPESHAASLELLAVDNWNGTPSVAISRGGKISFLAPGDATPDGVTLKDADANTQQAIFGLPSGQTSTLRAPR